MYCAKVILYCYCRIKPNISELNQGIYVSTTSEAMNHFILIYHQIKIYQRRFKLSVKYGI